MHELLLTKEQAYRAAYYFLENLYELTKEESLCDFLGSMQLGRDGRPFDPAYWEDWEKAVAKTMTRK